MRFIVLLALVAGVSRAQSFSNFTTPLPLREGETLVVGFLGGFEKWNDLNRGVRQTALRVRRTKGVYAETLANRNTRLARKLIRRAIDTNHNGKLEPAERAKARIVLYGQSWGGAAAIRLARDLNKMGIPVLLTVQLDSIGAGDSVIPPNVKSAANFYQREWLTFRGETAIKAADPSRTKIVGNFQQHYPPFYPGPVPESLPRKLFGGAHAKMEADPRVWSEVEKLILHTIEHK